MHPNLARYQVSTLGIYIFGAGGGVRRARLYKVKELAWERMRIMFMEIGILCYAGLVERIRD